MQIKTSFIFCPSNKNAVCGKKIRWTYINDKRMAHANHPFTVYFFLDLLFVASKLTFTRNCTTSVGASGRRTEIQCSLFMWYAGYTPSAAPNEPNISVGNFKFTTSITSSSSNPNLRRDTRITIAYHFLLPECRKTAVSKSPSNG